MKISYAVTVCNELVEIQRLLPFLLKHKSPNDEVIVLFDSKNGSSSVEQYLRASSVADSKFRWYSYEFKGDFSDMKNHLTHLCSGDYIFQVDADEMPNENLMRYLGPILLNNPVDVIRVPRVNTVSGLTPEHVQKWGWVVDGKGRVNWPDLQWRIYRKSPDIKWKNKVHEILDGYNTHSVLPLEEEFALQHHKDIKRQEKQNKLYNTL
jgi:hypothetical protein